MADGAGRLAQQVSVRRQLEEPTPEKSTPRAAKLPLRILYIVSRPADAGFIDPRLTSKALFEALDPLGPSVRVDFCRPPTVARMEEMLGDPNSEGAKRAFAAMMQMKKIDLAELQRAFAGD